MNDINRILDATNCMRRDEEKSIEIIKSFENTLNVYENFRSQVTLEINVGLMAIDFMIISYKSNYKIGMSST